MKKGFTLQELLGVIVVLGVIMLIASIGITNILKTSKESLNKTQIKKIESAAENWFINKDIYLHEGDNMCVKLTDLKSDSNSSYLDKDVIKDLTNNKKLNGCVKIEYKSNQYYYTYTESNCPLEKGNYECSE